MAATVLYTALADLEAWSAVASWPVPAGRVLPLDPNSAFTAALLAAGKIELAPDGAADTATPAHTLRGTPGLRVGVSN
jgi:hypothetical protein